MAVSREDVIGYLQQKLGLNTKGVDDDTLLFSSGTLDSFSMLDLVMFIETKIGRKLRATEVNLDNLDSIARIVRFASQ
jgi:acyl carrier protein